jgi:hypothetical protein
MKALLINYRSFFTGFALAFVAGLCFWSLAFAQENRAGIVTRGANLRAGPATTYPTPDDPNSCNVYSDLQFPQHVYVRVEEYYEERAEAQMQATE